MGVVNTYLKGASYLLHRNSFSLIRNIILDQSEQVIQDDSGVPFKWFLKEDTKWGLLSSASIIDRYLCLRIIIKRILTHYLKPRAQGLLDLGLAIILQIRIAILWSSLKKNKLVQKLFFFPLFYFIQLFVLDKHFPSTLF